MKNKSPEDFFYELRKNNFVFHHRDLAFPLKRLLPPFKKKYKHINVLRKTELNIDFHEEFRTDDKF